MEPNTPAPKPSVGTVLYIYDKDYSSSGTTTIVCATMLYIGIFLFNVCFLIRSATPFMTSVGKPLGRITLRDFKTVFDRPGFFRYHIKNTDTEYGMVKEEVSSIDYIKVKVYG